MLKVFLRRLLQIIPTLFVVIAFTFIATRVIPGDPVAAMVGDQYDVSKVEALKEELGLNKPILVQFGDYLKGIFEGDLGKSYYFNMPAIEMIKMRLPNTLLLSVTSLVFAVLVGVLLGVVSATHQSSITDYLLTVLSLFGISAPVFWVAIMLVLLFSVTLGWLPSFGMATIATDGFFNFLKHLAMPCFCLSIIPMGTFTRITRSSMIETLGSDSVRALRARGISKRSIVWKHALKNALPPIITVIGMQFAGCFAGAVLTENIFSWPGMGTMISSAIDNRDYSLIQATVLVVAIAFVLTNLLTDVLYMAINPKVAIDAKKGGM
ncbi:MAG: ABC transporter permease [Christensenellales bacterium]|jgi:peptide/nickel transport system permease protein